MRDLALYLHVGSLGIAFLGMLYADSQAMAWLRGTKDLLVREHLLRAHHAVGYALALNILSGLYLFWPMREYLLSQPMFWLKIGFVAPLLLNSFAIERLLHLPTRAAFRSLSRRQKLPLMLSGAVSLVCWAGAGITALVLFY